MVTKATIGSCLHASFLQALLLMRNLSINLMSPEFEDHVSFVSLETTISLPLQ